VVVLGAFILRLLFVFLGWDRLFGYGFWVVFFFFFFVRVSSHFVIGLWLGTCGGLFFFWGLVFF